MARQRAVVDLVCAVIKGLERLRVKQTHKEVERVIIVGNDSVKSHFLLTQRVKVHIVVVGQGLDLRQIKWRETDSRTHQDRFCGFARGQFENLILPDGDAVRFSAFNGFK